MKTMARITLSGRCTFWRRKEKSRDAGFVKDCLFGGSAAKPCWFCRITEGGFGCKCSRSHGFRPRGRFSVPVQRRIADLKHFQLLPCHASPAPPLSADNRACVHENCARRQILRTHTARNEGFPAKTEVCVHGNRTGRPILRSHSVWAAGRPSGRARTV